MTMREQFIIRRAGEYLSAAVVNNEKIVLFIRWRKSPYDAWMTESREEAENVAEKLAAEVLKFNPLTGAIG